MSASYLHSDEIQDLILRIQSENDPISKGKLIRFLNLEKQVRIIEIARLLDLSPSYICNLLRVLKLPELVIDGFYSKNITMTHLMAISRLKSESDIFSAYEKILSDSLSVIATHDLISEMLSGVAIRGDKVQAQIIKKIKEKFKLINEEVETKIVQTRTGAKVSLKLFGDREKTSQFLKELAD